MVSNLVDDLLESVEKEKTLLGIRGTSRLATNSLTMNTLSAGQLQEAAEANLINKDFLDKLTLRNEDIPDALKTVRGKPKYDPEAQFKLAFEAMGLSIKASITSVLDAIRVYAPRIQRDPDKNPVADWRNRRDLSVSAFREIIIATEVAMVDTTSAYITFKGQMQSIGNQIKPLEGLPSNITPQIEAMHRLAVEFQNNSTDTDFKELFTLKARDSKKGGFDQIGRAPGVGGGGAQALNQMRDYVTATDAHNGTQRRYWSLFISVVECYNLALEAIAFYDKINFELVTTTTTSGGFFRRTTTTTSTSAFPTLIATRDALRSQLTTLLALGGYGGVVGYFTTAANAISTAVPPVGTSTDVEIAAQLAYTKQFEADLLIFAKSLP